MIEGIASQAEKDLLDQLAQIRKAAGADGDDPATAAVHALDRLAKAKAAADGKTFGEAYDAVLRTAEGAQLYSITQGQTHIVDAQKALTSIRKIGA